LKVIAGNAERGPLVSTAIVLGAISLLGVTATSGESALKVAPAIALIVVFTTAYRALLSWKSLLALLTAVVMVVPMQRFVLPGSLPFELEPYRLLVAFIFCGWVASLLVDPRVKLRATGFELPLALLVGAVLASVLANGTRVADVGSDVAKALTFLVSFLLIFYFIVSVVRTRGQIDFLLKVLVAGGALVALEAIIESRTQHNLFNDLPRIIPLLKTGSLTTAPIADRGFRAYASAQHPIALGALLVVLLPPAAYLVHRTRQRRWGAAGTLLLFGALATLARTSVVMLVAVAVVFVWLRPRAMKRFWPLLVPALLAVHIALPGTIGTLKDSFFPRGGLLAEQKQSTGQRGQGRVADLGPSLREFAQTPLFGQGYATRRVEFGSQNAQILDDQWLGNLLETGLLGTIGWFWFFRRAIRRLVRRAKEDQSADGWLAVSLTASIVTFAIGMFTFDAFAFTQVTLVIFILIALASSLLARPADTAHETA
jgi:hypothetical protein